MQDCAKRKDLNVSLFSSAAIYRKYLHIAIVPVNQI